MTADEKTNAPAIPARSRGRRILGAPLFHFVLIGTLLFCAEGALIDPGPEMVVRLSEGDIAALEKGWQERNGRAPGPELLQALIDSRVQDELLLWEARAMGWHLTDAIVQRRLLQNQRFLEPDPDVSDRALLERAYAQAMDETDLVVRRRLLERMRLLVAARVRAQPPSEAELEDFLALNAEFFRRPQRAALDHVFLSRDSRGDRVLTDAEALGKRLTDEQIDPDSARSLGDPFLLSHRIGLSSEASIGRQYGPGFAARVMEAPVDRWSGPIASSYGAHLVWVHEYEASEIPPLAAIRARVESELLREREQAELVAHTARLRANAEVILPGPPPSL